MVEPRPSTASASDRKVVPSSSPGMWRAPLRAQPTVTTASQTEEKASTMSWTAESTHDPTAQAALAPSSARNAPGLRTSIRRLALGPAHLPFLAPLRAAAAAPHGSEGETPARALPNFPESDDAPPGAWAAWAACSLGARFSLPSPTIPLVSISQRKRATTRAGQGQRFGGD